MAWCLYNGVYSGSYDTSAPSINEFIFWLKLTGVEVNHAHLSVWTISSSFTCFSRDLVLIQGGIFWLPPDCCLVMNSRFDIWSCTLIFYAAGLHYTSIYANRIHTRIQGISSVGNPMKCTGQGNMISETWIRKAIVTKKIPFHVLDIDVLNTAFHFMPFSMYTCDGHCFYILCLMKVLSKCMWNLRYLLAGWNASR